MAGYSTPFARAAPPDLAASGSGGRDDPGGGAGPSVPSPAGPSSPPFGAPGAGAGGRPTTRSSITPGSQLVTAPSGRPPLPPRAASGAVRGASTQLANIVLYDSFDCLLPLSPSLDNFLARAGSAAGGGLESRGASMLSGRLFSTGAGKLSGMNSLDLNWLLADAGVGASLPAGPGVRAAGQDGKAAEEEALEDMQIDATAGALKINRHKRKGSGLGLERRPSAAALVVGATPPPAQLPAVEPLVVPQNGALPDFPPAAGSPHTPLAGSEGGKRAGLSALGLQQQQQAYAQQVLQQREAAAAAASAAAAAVAAGQDPTQSYAAQYAAAAAHAAQALALQQQMQMQQALLASCGTGAGAGSGPNLGLGLGLGGGVPSATSSLSSTTQYDLLSQYNASQAAAAAAVYGPQAAGLHSGARVKAEPGSDLLVGLAQPAGNGGGGAALGAGAGGAAGRAQPAGGGAQSVQDKITEWERQNALMAAFSAGVPCPELTAATLSNHSAHSAGGLPGMGAAGMGMGGMGGMGLGMGPMGGVPQPLPSYGGGPQMGLGGLGGLPSYAPVQYPQQQYSQQYSQHYSQQYAQPYAQQQYQQQFQQPRSFQVTVSTTPVVRLATASAVKVASPADSSPSANANNSPNTATATAPNNSPSANAGGDAAAKGGAAGGTASTAAGAGGPAGAVAANGSPVSQ